MKKRSKSNVLCMIVMFMQVLLLSVGIITVYDKNVLAAQKCGANATWELDYDTGVLTISGTGDMYDTPDFCLQREHIKKVVINSGITSIGENAFFLSNVTEVIIPNTVRSIGYRAFWGCEKLTELKFPASLISIDDYAIEKCPSLQSIVVDEKNTYFRSQNGVFYNKDKTKLLVYPAGKNQETFNIPEAVTSLGVCAFDYCTYLTVVSVPASVMKIEYSPFFGSNKLQQILVDENNLNYASVDGNLYNKQKTALIRVAPGKSYTEFEVSQEILSIESDAFGGCSSIKKITILNPECTVDQNSDTLPENAVVYGYTNSETETYAKMNSREFVSIGERETEKSTNNTVGGNGDNANNNSSGNNTNNTSGENGTKPNVTTSSTEKNTKVTKPNKVKGLKVKKFKKRAVRVSWKKVKSVSGYQIVYSTNKKFKKNKKVLKVKSSVTSKKISDLKKKTYYFKVRAYKKANGKIVYGNWSKVKIVKR